MRDQPGQHTTGYKGFKPWGKPGWPGENEEAMKLSLTQFRDKMWYFKNAPKDSTLWYAMFYKKEAALRVFDYLAKGGLLDAKV